MEYDASNNWRNIPGTEAAFRDCGNPERSCSRKTTSDNHIRLNYFSHFLPVVMLTSSPDLEEKKEEMVRGGTRGVLERGPRRESARESARRKVKTRKANNNSLLDTSSSSLNSIRAGQKYQAGKRGRREEEERRRVAGRREEEEERRKMSTKEEERRRVKEEKPACECGPVLERIGATIEKDRVGSQPISVGF